jgi:hypothetical protein
MYCRVALSPAFQISDRAVRHSALLFTSAKASQPGHRHDLSMGIMPRWVRGGWGGGGGALPFGARHKGIFAVLELHGAQSAHRALLNGAISTSGGGSYAQPEDRPQAL